MSNRWKNALYSLILITAMFVVWKFRQSKAEEPLKIEGSTMGTTYHITYFDAKNRNFKPAVDSLLKVFNQSLSTYIPDSEISKFNRSQSFVFESPYLSPVLNRSAEISRSSGGAFDPTVMPLVNAWGFGPGKKIAADSAKIDSIKQFIGFDKLQFNEDSLWKTDPRVQLDFSAIAKGYGVDEVAGLLNSNGVENLFVEIGGEIVVQGRNIKSGKDWEVGILNPNSTYENHSYVAYVSLTDKGMATSGNYFNYYEENGVKYSHTIDPVSGYPIRHALLSASVFAKDCMTADAWATAFMVLGYEKAVELLNQHPELDAFLIYNDAEGFSTYSTEGIKQHLTLNP